MKVLFVAGTGRSGSTLLNLFLGKSPEVVALGELMGSRNELDERMRNHMCTCGDKGVDCKFWGGLSKFLKLNTETDYHESLLRYIEQHHPEKKIIVDDSKNIDKLLHWTKLKKKEPTLELYVIHLVRDIRGWTYSHHKRRKSSSALNKLYWLVRNVRAWYMQNKTIKKSLNELVGQHLTIGYEEFIFDREKIVDLIFANCRISNNISNYNTLVDSNAHELSEFSRVMKEGKIITYDFYWMNHWPCSFIVGMFPGIFKMLKKYVYGHVDSKKRIAGDYNG